MSDLIKHFTAATPDLRAFRAEYIRMCACWASPQVRRNRKGKVEKDCGVEGGGGRRGGMGVGWAEGHKNVTKAINHKCRAKQICRVHWGDN